MRAKSIEDIREHLAKGGRVFCTVVPTTSVSFIENHHIIIRSPFAFNPQIMTYYGVPLGEFDPQEWELEPLSLEKKCWLCNGSKTLYNEFEPVDCPQCTTTEKNRQELKRMNDKHHQMLVDRHMPMVQHINKLEAILSNIAVMVGAEPSKDPFECEQRILEKLDKTLPLDIKLDHLRECILDGSEEDALEHLFDLLKGLRCKYIEDKHLTRSGIEKKAWWNESR